jgi:SAM-dependent methyltransferase
VTDVPATAGPPGGDPSGGPPGDPYQIRWAERAGVLVAAAGTDAEWYDAVAHWLVEPADSWAVDVGCGGGGMAAALSRAVPAGPGAGRVLAVDGDPAVLAAARSALVAGPVPVDFVLADLDGDLSEVADALGGPADLVWASASVHHAGDQQRAVDRLAGLLGPGGRLALAEGGLSPRCLPWDLGVGTPGLEARLDAAQDAWFRRMRAALPGSVPMPYGWPEALHRAGLSTVASRSWLLELPTPLSTMDREGVVADLARRVDWLRPAGSRDAHGHAHHTDPHHNAANHAENLLSADDLAAWDRLLDPADPAWLGARSDLYRVAARTVHIGRREQGPAPPRAPTGSARPARCPAG